MFACVVFSNRIFPIPPRFRVKLFLSVPSEVSVGKEPLSNLLFFREEVFLPPDGFFLRMLPCHTDKSTSP